MHRVKHCGASFSAKKIQLCQSEVVIVRQKYTKEGRIPDNNRIKKITDWPILKTVEDVRGFLKLCGIVRSWIRDYSQIARPLTELIRKDIEFIWNDRR